MLSTSSSITSMYNIKNLRPIQSFSLYNKIVHSRLFMSATFDKIDSHNRKNPNDKSESNVYQHLLPRVLSVQSHTVHGYVGKLLS